MTSLHLSPGAVCVCQWQGDMPTDAALSAALGGRDVDTDKLDIFPAKRIAPVGLATYLIEGHGLSAEDVAPYEARFADLDNVIVVLSTRAFGGEAVDLTISPPLVHLATFEEPRKDAVTPVPLTSDSAEGRVGAEPSEAPKSDARIGGMVAFVVLLFLAAFVTVFVLSSG